MSSERDRYDRMYAAFEAARLRTFDERDTVLERICGPDVALRREVEALLRAHDTERADAFSDESVEGARQAIEAARVDLLGLARRHASGPTAWRPGARLGPYQLLRKLRTSEGSETWLAESAPPRPRRVSVELASAAHAREHPGFERAAAVLRDLEHPNLTRVEDSGITPDDGRFLVTELCLGTPLLDHVAEAELGFTARAALFLAICEGARALDAAGLAHPRLGAAEVTVASLGSTPTPKLSGLVAARPTDARGACADSTPTQLGALFEELLAVAPRCSPPAAIASLLGSSTLESGPALPLAEWIRGLRAALEAAEPRRGVFRRLRGLLP